MSTGTSKKSYSPKPDKLVKLSKYHAEIKGNQGSNCDLFTKNGNKGILTKVVKGLFLCLLFTSCSANWHLKRACKKMPSLCTPQVVKIDTIVKIDSVRYNDTILMKAVDTITIENERLKLQIIVSKNIILILKQWRVHLFSIFAPGKGFLFWH